ncbi:hypothetical protein [Spiroplasma endosymbiont of Colias croceus]|uniref:hypothetical protein n=1 Tax=Spiroplasma endosymbiont of Colias croceus TaxID=3066310 RepID=UPI0030CEB886
MTNYLLSIDPSIKNTGFTLWEKTKRISECEVDYREIEYIYKWKPIWVKSFDFKNIKKDDDFYKQIKYFISKKIHFEEKINGILDLIIERGTFHSKNGIGYETQEHLRGFIAGQFNKLITKNMLISPSEWKKWYLKELRYDEDDLFKDKKWNKEKSLYIVRGLIRQQNWNITISNHDEADSLLMGWYYLNKENK